MITGPAKTFCDCDSWDPSSASKSFIRRFVITEKAPTNIGPSPG